jgi:tyrosyl-tRNA synthetase
MSLDNKNSAQGDLAADLVWRNLIKDKTFDNNNWLNEPKSFYVGVDCNSSDSMTIGNLAVMLLAKRLVSSGWRAYVLVGGATSLVGDPGGKDKERDLKPADEIEANVKGIEGQIKRLFDGDEFELVNNFDWFSGVKFLDFLRDVGKHYSMSDLLARDFISERLGSENSGISYAEFSYTLIQGYDFWHLFKEYGVVLQIGGSDQWGNMISGVPLIRKKEQAQAHAFSAPLVIDKSTGKKFGKSEDGAIWLDENKTSVFSFYQFWLNVSDDDVEEFLKIYTLMSQAEIEAVMTKFVNDKSTRYAQSQLARAVTAIVHGTDKAESAERVTKVLFKGGSYAELSSDDFDLLKTELLVYEGDDSSLLADILVDSGLLSSKGEVRRAIDQAAISINGEKISGANIRLSQFEKLDNGYQIVKYGKNKFLLLIVR